MAHFAKLNENNVVLEVHCVNNLELLDSDGNESEALGCVFLVNWSGGHPYWKQTSYNRTFRKNFAGAGWIYDPIRDAFIAPQPSASCILNEETCRWEYPTPYPTDGRVHRWDEDTKSWIWNPPVTV